jgi:alpha-N-arabinofuranosidase
MGTACGAIVLGVVVLGLARAGEPAQAPAKGKSPHKPPLAGTVSIDAAEKGQPISKYIYGQFIEHLGRCIYGGIWAEMLEDRKFFYPVDAKESPWKSLGGPGTVEMVRENAFVGAHTPKITATKDGPAGIVQAGLGLVKGKQYVGRIWIAAQDPPGGVAAASVRVILVWGPKEGDRQSIFAETPKAEFAKFPLRFTAGESTDNGRLEITVVGQGSVLVGTVSLMPADNVQGMRADTLAVLRELDSPIYRWPGGNFVSGYNWKDGIGDPDRRPPRTNPAWQGLEHNDFGINEFTAFCRHLGTEPYVVVNSGQGNVQLAVDMLQYANGGPETPMGKLRASHGHHEPYAVKWWGIGNEMYGSWQLGHMPLEKYIQKHKEFAKAMRAEDPSIKLIGVGAVGPWTVGMLTHAADAMDCLSEHFYCQSRPDLVAHVRLIPDQVRRIAEAHRKYRKEIPSLAGKDLRIALDEWNYWYGPHVFGELGTRYFLRDGLGVAAGLNEYARQSDIYVMANYAQTVNVIGAIKTSKTAAALETTGLVLAMYRKHFGEIPVATRASEPLDAQAAWSTDGKTLTLAIVNPTERRVEVALALTGAKLTGRGRLWRMAGTDPMAYNDPDQPSVVEIRESGVRQPADKPTLPPMSASLYAFEVEK